MKGTGEGLLVVGLPQMDLNALCMALHVDVKFHTGPRQVTVQIRPL
jgi:hypothetical protein